LGSNAANGADDEHDREHGTAQAKLALAPVAN
jgi:hypothetical protein